MTNHEEFVEYVTSNQLDAIVRTIALIGDARNLTFEDVFAALAKAEKDAVFLCGFVDLYEKHDVREMLHALLLKEELVIIDQHGYLNLTPAGMTRSKKQLPAQIEKFL